MGCWADPNRPLPKNGVLRETKKIALVVILGRRDDGSGRGRDQIAARELREDAFAEEVSLTLRVEVVRGGGQKPDTELIMTSGM